MLVLSHFKATRWAASAARSNSSIGCASSAGKAYIHGAGKPEEMWTTEQNAFLESMADAAESVVKLFDGKIVYINVMKNLSVDCDCCAVAEDPCMADIGILASLDPIAVDQACLDLVYASDDPGRDHLVERIESSTASTVEAAAELGFGSREYELIEALRKIATKKAMAARPSPFLLLYLMNQMSISTLPLDAVHAALDEYCHMAKS